MIFFPKAKINLGLHILVKRQDGYHNLETLLIPIPLHDSVEFIPSGKTSLITYLKPNPKSYYIRREESMESPDNLILKAYHILKSDFNIPNLSFYLYKNIPIGAGLGGGSSDAAYTLKCLNDTFFLGIEPEKLILYAQKLGSDCTCFLEPRPYFATGKGDNLSPFEINLENYFWVVVKPPFSISTAEAYARIKPKIPQTPILEILNGPIENWRNNLVNDFEPTIFGAYPKLADLKNQLYKSGAIYASLSGSGSALFALFNEFIPLKGLEVDNQVFYLPKKW